MFIRHVLEKCLLALLCLSICPAVHTHINLASTGWIFVKHHIGNIYVNLLTELKFGHSGPKTSDILCDLNMFYC